MLPSNCKAIEAGIQIESCAPRKNSVVLLSGLRRNKNEAICCTVESGSPAVITQASSIPSSIEASAVISTVLAYRRVFPITTCRASPFQTCSVSLSFSITLISTGKACCSGNFSVAVIPTAATPIWCLRFLLTLAMIAASIPRPAINKK